MTKAVPIASQPVAPSLWQRNLAGLPIALGVLALFFGWHIAVGAKSLSLTTVIQALVSFDDTLFDHMIVRDLRLPRAIVAMVVGASLSVAGALMQGVTRNPLAEPGILGLLAGASFAVVMAVGVFGLASTVWLPAVAALGALMSAMIVWAIAQGSPGGATPLTLTLAGAAVTLFLGAMISIAHLLSQDTFEQLRVWLAGSLSARRTHILPVVLPWVAVAMVFALGLARQVTVLAMGDETARGLGVRTGWLKTQLLLVVVVLTACSVALAGPLGFVGLVIPHVVRLFVGSDYRWIVPYCALVGAAYLIGVDTLARLVLRPQEIATGIVTALVGAPLFVHLVRQRVR